MRVGGDGGRSQRPFRWRYDRALAAAVISAAAAAAVGGTPQTLLLPFPQPAPVRFELLLFLAHGHYEIAARTGHSLLY
jgi:hypothetical protein